jgi:signal transduction histidine kinase
MRSPSTSARSIVRDTVTDIGSVFGAQVQAQSDARLAGRVLTAHYFSPQVQITLLDQHRRVELFRRSQALPFTFVVVGRNDVSQTVPAPNIFSRTFFALATLFGLEADRATIGPLLVVVRVQPAALARAVLQFLPIVGLALACAIALSITFARLLALQALRPLNDVTRALGRLAEGDLTPRSIPAGREHQLRDLTHAYNGAIARVESAFAERDEAHAAMRQFIADAGHQLRTPLTVVRGFIGILLRGTPRESADLDPILTSMNRQCVEMGSLIDKLILLDVWAGENEPAEVVDVSQLVEDVVTPIAEASPAHNLVIDVQPGALARIDPIGCSHALTNLVDNAIKYAPGSRIGVRLVREGETIRIDVEDDGRGMTADEVQHVFDRFYRGPLHRAVTGSGLGLPIARSAIERAGGTLVVDSEPGHGARFTIRLPSAGAGVEDSRSANPSRFGFAEAARGEVS